jgi:hypothetical protein
MNELLIVINYRVLYSIIIKVHFFLFLLDKLIDYLQGKYFFLKIDFHLGYHPNQIASSNIEKTILIGLDSL